MIEAKNHYCKTKTHNSETKSQICVIEKEKSHFLCQNCNIHSDVLPVLSLHLAVKEVKEVLVSWVQSVCYYGLLLQDDCLVKVWYSSSKWQRDVTPLDLRSGAQISFSFIYLSHPRSVTGFSWRKTSAHLPRWPLGPRALVSLKLDLVKMSHGSERPEHVSGSYLLQSGERVSEDPDPLAQPIISLR